jgi:putative transposase
LFIGLGHDKFEAVQLNSHVFSKVSKPDVKMRSLTITSDRIGICYSVEVKPIQTKTVFGVDRNEKNLTFGNRYEATRINISAIPRIKQTTREIISSFKRNDVRLRRKLSQKYWRRATGRTSQALNDATNLIVQKAGEQGAAIALEDITNINRMYRKGNGQGKDYRFRMNSWPHFKAYRMIDYKSALNGVTVVKLTKGETRGSSSIHFCGEKLRRPTRGDVKHRRQLWCDKCQSWTDRDVVAVANLAARGLSRLASSLPAGAKGPAVEAVIGNPTMKAIPGVDASKLTTRREPMG